MAKKNDDKDKEKDPQMNEDLKGFEIGINEFGEIVSTLSVDKLNNFLDKNVEDKKLKNQVDDEPLDEEKEEEDDSLFGKE